MAYCAITVFTQMRCKTIAQSQGPPKWRCPTTGDGPDGKPNVEILYSRKYSQCNNLRTFPFRLPLALVGTASHTPGTQEACGLSREARAGVRRGRFIGTTNVTFAQHFLSRDLSCMSDGMVICSSICSFLSTACCEVGSAIHEIENRTLNVMLRLNVL